MADDLESGSDVVSDGGSDEANEAEPISQDSPETTGDYDLTDPESISQHSDESSSPGETTLAGDDSPPEFDPKLVAAAESLGYPRDVALAYGTPEALKQRLTQDLQARQQIRQSQQQHVAYQQQQQAAYQQQAYEQQQQQFQVPKYDLQLDPDVYAADDPFTQQLNALNDHYQQMAQNNWDWIAHLDQNSQQVAQQQQQQQQAYEQAVSQQQQQAAHQNSVDVFDRVVVELGEYADVLGEGRTSDINQSSDQWGNRDALFRRWASIEQEYRNSGKPLPPDAEVARQAAQSLWGGQPAQPTTQPTNGERARDPNNGRYVSTLTQRPTHRAGKPLSGVDKAANRIESFFEERADQFDEEQILS